MGKHQTLSCKICEAKTAKLKEEIDKYKYLETWTLFFQQLMEKLDRKIRNNREHQPVRFNQRL